MTSTDSTVRYSGIGLTFIIDLCIKLWILILTVFAVNISNQLYIFDLGVWGLGFGFVPQSLQLIQDMTYQ